MSRAHRIGQKDTVNIYRCVGWRVATHASAVQWATGEGTPPCMPTRDPESKTLSKPLSKPLNAPLNDPKQTHRVPFGTAGL